MALWRLSVQARSGPKILSKPMSFKIGIIGLPNVGKSTLFKALTRKQVDISNYPFCTINPNIGCARVPDERLKKLSRVLHPEKIIPTVIEFVDIAGLVAGAHKGEGLGNQFLAHIREVEAICEVVRAFPDPNVAHVSGKIDPKSDIEIINLELVMADLKTVEKRITELQPKARSGDKEAAKNLLPLLKVKSALEAGKPAREIELSDEEKSLIHDLHLLTQKPILFVMNVNEDQILNTKYKIPDTIPICAKLEAEIADLPEAEAKAYLQELNLAESGLDQLIKASYKLLNLITFFTTQNKILQAWAIPSGATAQMAAGKIHTDFERGFIKALVINWQDLVAAGGEVQAKEKGLIRTEGKDYVVCDGDVIEIKFKD